MCQSAFFKIDGYLQWIGVISVLIVLNESVIWLERLKGQIFIYGGISSHAWFQIMQWVEKIQLYNVHQ